MKKKKKKMKEQRVKRERETKKLYSTAKKNLIRGHSFMRFTKKVEISDPQALLSLDPQVSNFRFWPKCTPSWTSLIGILYLFRWVFWNFPRKFNNDIKIVMYKFFLC